MIKWVLIIIILFVIGRSTFSNKISHTVIPQKTNNDLFYKKWNSVVLSDRVSAETLAGQEVWVLENPVLNIGERIVTLAQRPHFYKGTFFAEKMISVPLQSKGPSLVGILEGRSIELDIINDFSCELRYDGDFMAFTKL
jgi:hypothetical protein